MDGGSASFRHLSLRRGESLRFVVRGNCMPGLPDETSVTVTKRLFYLPGDVVVVRRRDHWNVHRFLGYALGPRGWVALTRADRATASDPASRIERIEGSVTQSVPVLQRARAFGHYFSALRERFGRTL